MSEKYIIRNECDALDVWDKIEELKVSNYPWNTNDYMPEMYAKMYYTDSAINVLMYAFEKYPRATFHSINDKVCRDSCLEFFLQPFPEKDKRYFNFEFNPWGVYLLGIGLDRHHLEFIDERIIKGLFSVKNKIKKIMKNGEVIYIITIEFSIPHAFISNYFSRFEPYSGKLMKGNFYKCGDDTIYPHYGCWNNIIHDFPDFHRSEYFGTLIME